MSKVKEEKLADVECKSCEGTVGYSDIYKGLWKCRDFELAHYWQRSVFLTAFLLACYAGYGALIAQCATAETVKLPIGIVNGIAFGICVVGIILSLLWIMMAKGSKAWYEIYEAAISAFVDRYAKTREAFAEDLANVAGFYIRDVGEFEQPKKSDWLWNSVGGRYSVSRINVALGHLSVVIWFGLAIVHISIAGANVTSMAELQSRCRLCADPALMCAAGIVALLLFWVYARLVLKSTHLN
ncbi:MAG: hypothetical protein E7049_07075 [Lentisphaerae bacterium]|nr:hypothetical protein [Lentisphaerota bacterium]